MIQYVREQARSVRQIALADAGTVHAWISLPDEQAVAKDSTIRRYLSPRAESWRCRCKCTKATITMMQTKPTLNTASLTLQAQIALHQHLHQQHQDHAAIQNRDGQQVEDRQVQADHATSAWKNADGTFARGVAGQVARCRSARYRFLGDMRRSTIPLRNWTISSAPLLFWLHGFAERVRQGELGGDDVELLLRHHADHPARRAVHACENTGCTVTVVRLAVALVFDLDRLAAAVLGDLLELDLRVDRLAVDGQTAGRPS